MKRYRVEVGLAALMAVVFAFVWHWQVPHRTLTKTDVDDYIRRIAAGIELPGNEKAEIIEHLRSWGEADDGKPERPGNMRPFAHFIKSDKNV